MVRFLYGLTSRLVDMHEDHFIVCCQDGVELLVTDRGQLGHVPRLTLVHRHIDCSQSALQRKRRERVKKRWTWTKRKKEGHEH